jgi:hypothetical protein
MSAALTSAKRCLVTLLSYRPRPPRAARTDPDPALAWPRALAARSNDPFLSRSALEKARSRVELPLETVLACDGLVSRVVTATSRLATRAESP